MVQDWTVCTSPRTYGSLKAGTYLFSLRGTDAAGNVSTVKTVSLAIKK